MAKKTKEGGVSRRAFLRGSAAGAVASGWIGGRTDAEPAPPDAGASSGFVGPAPVLVALDINGQPRELEVEPRETLLDVLRHRLELTGAKRVCDRATCGACTVLCDGAPFYSCTLLAIEAQGRAIVTVESLGSPESLHPLQAAFVEHDAQQCGYCTPGFVMAAKALLDRRPDPSREEVVNGLGGNLCRCGTYDGLKAALTTLGRS